MGEIHDFVFNEDLDLNAAAAQLAAAKGQLNCNLPDADTIKLPAIDGMELRYIKHADETAGGLDAYLHFLGAGSERKFRIGQNVLAGDLLINEIHFKPGEWPLAAGQRIKAFGGKSGAGAEQHSIVIGVYMPDLNAEKYTGPVKHMHMLGVMTGTLVAQTVSGLNSILGDETALPDSEIQFAEKRNYVLKGYWPTPGGAGYGVLGVRHPNGKHDSLCPAVFAQAVRAPFVELNWKFNGEAPPRAVGCGVGTTSTELTMLLGEID